MRTGHTAAIAAVVVAAGGCLDRFTQPDSPSLRNKPVETPKVSEAHVALAGRVDHLSKELLAATPFFPVEPTFHTVAAPEPLLTHPDLHGALISDGLAQRCRSDAELAALLAWELGRMAAEKRTAERLRPDADPRAAGETDARAIAGELLNAAGYAEADLDTIAPLLAAAEEHRKSAPRLGAKPTAPNWSP